MVKLKIDGKEYDMVSSWEDVTIEQSYLIDKLFKEEKSDLLKSVELISILSGVPLDILMVSDIDDLVSIDLSWCGEEIKSTYKSSVIIDSEVYYVVDNHKMTLAEYVDLDYYLKDAQNNLHFLMAIYLKKKVNGEYEKYSSDNVKERAELFYKRMYISDCLGISNFFLNGESGYSKNMKTSL